MTIAINGIGLATAQGNVAQVLSSVAPRTASALPWTPNRWNVSRVCYPALGINAALSSVARWQALARKAFDDVRTSAKTPLLVASCNGGATERWEDAFDTSALLARTPWADERLPVFSSSCASGIHALYAARQLLQSGAVDEVMVLAADVLAQSNHENFESLRVLAEGPCVPWQPASSGFILGEAAVVLRLVRAQDEETILHGPVLESDLVEHDGLACVMERVSTRDTALILGQGTGPFANDTEELAAFSAYVERNVPLTTPLTHFGHTLGASALLAVALGALIHQSASIPSSLQNDPVAALDGRPLCRGGTTWPPLARHSDPYDVHVEKRGGHGVPPLQNIVMTCRALNGACGASWIGVNSHGMPQPRSNAWRNTTTHGPLMNETLRHLAKQAPNHRPTDPPDVLILRLEQPLSPPPAAIIGGRLLPSAVLEITPGFASQLIARCWGFAGPALCLVGDVDKDPYGLTNAFRESGQNVFQVNLRGTGDKRAIEWNV